MFASGSLAPMELVSTFVALDTPLSVFGDVDLSTLVTLIAE